MNYLFILVYFIFTILNLILKFWCLLSFEINVIYNKDIITWINLNLIFLFFSTKNYIFLQKDVNHHPKIRKMKFKIFHHSLFLILFLNLVKYIFILFFYLFLYLHIDRQCLFLSYYYFLSYKLTRNM